MQQQRGSRRLLWSLRCLLLDLPLVLVAALYFSLHMLNAIYREFYVPLFDRATRTDDDLMEEYTYYNRECTEYDLSTDSFQDLVAAEATRARTEQMLRHGGMIIPSVLRPESVRRLRSYIVQRNSEISAAERYPVSQGYRRISYGIDPTEDPAVADSVAEITANPVFRSTLAALLGDEDPASAEITAITGYAGCPDQVWHQDTKADGNAIKFARTYSHSYSFFVALQNTTHDMGATDFCPGTHFCTNSLEVLCERRKMRLSDATPEKAWRAGDGALLNQHVWHRGSAHVDPDAPERILFILSFLARPNLGTSDTRQLSRGTYFHQKWLMWGHTYQDLLDPTKSMRTPFSVLRCLSLWKPPGYRWGYDLVTATFMRFANAQLEDEDLPTRFVGRLDQLGFPEWLRGRVLEDVNQKEAWTTFIGETIDNTLRFVKGVAALYLSCYAVMVGFACAVASRRTAYSGRSVALAATRRVLLLVGSIAVLSYWICHRVQTSEWAFRIRTGRTLMRAFPASANLRSSDRLGISSGPTTMPHRNDVLLGTRFDAKFLGSYDRWLDFHPGNLVLRESLQLLAPAYVTWTGSAALQESILRHVQEEIRQQNGGGTRILQQDHSTGNWRVLTAPESREALHEELASSGNEVVSMMRKELDYAIADCRFGVKRGSALARLGLGLLWHLKKRILRSDEFDFSSKQPTGMSASGLRKLLLLHFHNSTLKSAQKASSVLLMRGSSIPSQAYHELRPGTLVIVYFPLNEFYYPGTIHSVNEDESTASVSYLSGEYEERVDMERIVVRKPVVQGSKVMGCYLPELEDCYPGIIRQVHPSGTVLIAFEDGEVSWFSPSDYYLPPYPTFFEPEE
jgi:hypothetical protein